MKNVDLSLPIYLSLPMLITAALGVEMYSAVIIVLAHPKKSLIYSEVALHQLLQLLLTAYKNAKYIHCSLSAISEGTFETILRPISWVKKDFAFPVQRR